MTSNNKRGFEADIPRSSAFHDAERSGMEGHPPQQATALTGAQPGAGAGRSKSAEASPERTPWMSFMARHLFDDVDPAILALNEEGREDGPADSSFGANITG